MDKLQKILIIFSVLCVILLPKIYLWFTTFGVGVHFYNVYPGLCKSIPGVICGSEKISVTSDGLAFITSGIQDVTNCDPLYLHGRIYLFDFNDPYKKITELYLKSNSLKASTFSPHGMDVFEDLKNGVVKLLVINHGNHSETIEVFLFRRDDPSYLDHVKTITDEKFLCLNDISVINENLFYVTNYLKYCQYNYLASLFFEASLKVNTANIVYYNKGQTSFVVDGYSTLNGIAVNKNFSMVFVASSSKKSLIIFNRDQETGKLNFYNAIDLVYSPDNVYIDHHTGSIYVAVLKKPLHMFLGLKNLTHGTATGLKIVSDSNQWENADVTEIFHDNGKLIQSASMFVYYKDSYLVGSIHNSLVYCN